MIKTFKEIEHEKYDYCIHYSKKGLVLDKKKKEEYENKQWIEADKVREAIMKLWKKDTMKMMGLIYKDELLKTLRLKK